MASSPSRRLLLAISAAAIVLSLLSAAAAGRPCRTFFISTYSFSLRLPPNDLPTDLPSNPNFPYSQNTLATFTHIRSFVPIYYHVVSTQNDIPQNTPLQIKPKETLLGFSNYDFDSLRDRTKDILSVVVALLFGVGCGALTAATMYLVWSMFSNRYEVRPYGDYLDDEDDDDDENDGFESPRKMGYVKIHPPPPAAVAKDVA